MIKRQKKTIPKSPTMIYTTKKMKSVSYMYIDIVDNDEYFEYY